MGNRTRHALIALGFAALAPSLAAQNPPPVQPPSPAARDSAARDTNGVAQLLYSDLVVGSLAPRILLTKGEVYRFEIDPADAGLVITSARRPRLGPLFLVPLPQENFGGAAAYLVVPPSTEEYLVGISGQAQVRIWLDPRESARFNRIRTEGFRLPILAINLSATYLAPFRDWRASPADALLGFPTGPQAAYGVKLCLDVLPNGRILPDRTGGCALAFTLWQRGKGRNFFTLGIEPEVVVLRRPLQQLAVTPQLAIGNTTGGAPYANYVFYGLGARYTAVLAAIPRLGFQTQANLLELDSKPDAPDASRVHTLTVSLEAGIVFKL